MTHREYRRDGAYYFFSFLLLFLLFCILCGVTFKSVLESIFSIISTAEFRNNKKTRQYSFGSGVISYPDLTLFYTLGFGRSGYEIRSGDLVGQN